MINNIILDPSLQTLPSELADRLGIYYSQNISTRHKKENGQFFTPLQIARLMASYSNITKTKINVLDPGCGTAILTCALIENILKTKTKIEIINLVAYETDVELIPFSQQILTYLKEWLLKQGIIFQYILHIHDFVLDNAKALKKDYNGDKFDIIISNPPYFKLKKDDKKTIATKELINGQPNIYSIFMGLSAKLLSENGELIFITPRSFASGNYFKAFRVLFFDTVQIDKIHLFNSRKDTFNRDKVLQETVVVKAIKENINPNKNVLISSCIGINDIFNPTIKYFKHSVLIDLNSKEKIFHLPTNEKDENILDLVFSWKNVIGDFNIKISTGPVVSFRAIEFIQNSYDKDNNIAPLFWLNNVNKMILEWPKRLENKGQFIKTSIASKSMLLPNKNYILLRRFSTKDDKSRLIAAPYFCNYFLSDFIGIENKVNYIYRKDGHLDRNEVVGLCGLLNSELFDSYFQIFNGNVNVSATELRVMKFPPLEKIKEIGNKIIVSNDYSMNNVNKIVNDSI